MSNDGLYHVVMNYDIYVGFYIISFFNSIMGKAAPLIIFNLAEELVAVDTTKRS